MRKVLLFGGVVLSAALAWFAISNYQSARPVAEENLRGLALSLTAAIENIALHDPSLHSLDTFQTHDIAFFALIDRQGIYRFHSNPDLIGTPLQGAIPLATLKDGVITTERITLLTGENAFEFDSPLRLPGKMLALRLVLHTYRADGVIRRARLNMTALFVLLTAAWILALALYRYTRREDRHQLEMERRQSLAQLGEMGAMLAHEIRNPLAGIKGYAQVIEKKPQDERNSGFARRIVAEIQRLETLVNNLLSYAGSAREPLGSVNLNEVISHAVDLLRPEAEQLNIEIISQCPEGIQVTGNSDRLGQVLLNLGKNSVQSMPDGGTLQMMAENSGTSVIVRVTDTGYGINREELPRIFEPFFTTKAKGSGLGLALCRKIIEELGGSIEVESTVGAGTSVFVTIPRERNHQGRSLS
ncbi:MAG: histidine kinase [Proteobacteria bacterium]|nr:histidine kinase [Pseudomonadota bacterium]